MKRKLIISIAIVIFVLSAAAVFHEITKKTEPPGLDIPTADAISEDAHTSEQSDETATTIAVSNETSETLAAPETFESQTNTKTLYTSYDPLHSFSITFNENTIEVSGVYEGDRVTRISLSDSKSTKPEYYGNRIYAELTTDSSDDNDKLIVHFSSGWSLPVHITCNENGLPCALLTDAAARSELALAHPIPIPHRNVMEYVMPDADSEARTAVLEQIQYISDSVCNGITDDYDKARALAMWVAQNIYYDYVAFETAVTVNTLSLARTLELQRTVCGGYANLYAALCQAQGITCHVVKGTVIQGGGSFAEGGHEAPSHEWNVVELNGRHIWVDNLWNTTNGYDGEYYFGDQTYRYFDISDECMAINHRAERVEIRNFYE